MCFWLGEVGGFGGGIRSFNQIRRAEGACLGRPSNRRPSNRGGTAADGRLLFSFIVECFFSFPKTFASDFTPIDTLFYPAIDGQETPPVVKCNSVAGNLMERVMC